MKKVLVSILISIFVMSMCISVNAATASITMTSTSHAVNKGKTFKVTIEGTANNNITGLEATLTYDTSALKIEEKVAGENFYNAAGSNSELAILSEGTTFQKSGTLYTITFKVLDTATVGETTIAVKNAIFALVDDNKTQTDVNVSDEEVIINIKEDTKPKDEEKNNTTNNNSDKKPSNTNKDTTTKLPQTGVENVSIIAIILLVAISIAAYVSYKKYKNI